MRRDMRRICVLCGVESHRLGELVLAGYRGSFANYAAAFSGKEFSISSSRMRRSSSFSLARSSTEEGSSVPSCSRLYSLTGSERFRVHIEFSRGLRDRPRGGLQRQSNRFLAELRRVRAGTCHALLSSNSLQDNPIGFRTGSLEVPHAAGHTPAPGAGHPHRPGRGQRPLPHPRCARSDHGRPGPARRARLISPRPVSSIPLFSLVDTPSISEGLRMAESSVCKKT